jgi:hypothetical protein
MLGRAKAEEKMPVLQKGLKEEEVIDGERLSEFVEEADVPDFIQGLGDVKESRRAAGLEVKGTTDCVNETVGLFSGGVSASEAMGRRRVRRSFSRTLDTIGSRLIGR